MPDRVCARRTCTSSILQTQRGLTRRRKIERAVFLPPRDRFVCDATKRLRLGRREAFWNPRDFTGVPAGERLEENAGSEIFSRDVGVLGVQGERHRAGLAIREPE